MRISSGFLYEYYTYQSVLSEATPAELTEDDRSPMKKKKVSEDLSGI